MGMSRPYCSWISAAVSSRPSSGDRTLVQLAMLPISRWITPAEVR